MIRQLPAEPCTWLYKDYADGTRLWAREVSHPDGAPLWAQATEAEYEQWQAEHPAAAYTAVTENENASDGAGAAGGRTSETV